MPPPFHEEHYRLMGGKRFICRLCKQAQRIAGSKVVMWAPNQRMRICSACAKAHDDKDKQLEEKKA
jgi:hypothetical protein